MNLDKFKGVFCALNAIYDENDNIDVEKIKALVRVYKSLGVKGVYACGSTGEGFLLSTEERKQVAKAVKEAAEFEAQDKKRKEAIDTRNDADAMVFQTEKALEEVGDKVDANDKTAVEADLNELKDLIAKSNPEEMTESQVAEIKAAKEKLMESAQKVFAKMYEQQAQANGAAQAGPDMNAGADNSSYQSDDVVDGDYKEV